jgi:ParB family transcriptional regulator, chromosome partitioning protein
MANKKSKGLGMGLEALLGPKISETSAATESAGSTRMLALHLLQPGKYQPRTRMDEGSLYELAESIKAQGIMQPILVRPVEAGRFEIIAGERRSRAAKLAGLSEIPVLIREVPDDAAAAMALIENIQREDLNPLEEAQGIQRLVQEFGMTHEQAAQAVGRSRSAVSNLLRLTQLTDPVQKMLMAGDLDMGHARALLPLQGAQQIQAASQVVAKAMNVRETEKLVHSLSHSGARQKSLLPAEPPKSKEILRFEQQLSDALMAPVEIRIKKRTSRGDHGEVSIGFGSLEELNGVLERLGLVESSGDS